MIEYLRGTLIEKHPTFVVMEAGGLGYRVAIPLSSYGLLGKVGSEIKLLTHHHVREESEELYGFATAEERTLFELLIHVSGIGPRLAQAVLSGMPAPALREALVTSDLASLTRIPGVGKKTAERMVLELRDKVAKLVPESGVPAGSPQSVSEDDEAVLALVTLGFNRYEARRAVSQIRQQAADMPVEEIVREAIQSVR